MCSLLASINLSRGLRSDEESCSFTLATSFGWRMSNQLCPKRSSCYKGRENWINKQHAPRSIDGIYCFFLLPVHNREFWKQIPIRIIFYLDRIPLRTQIPRLPRKKVAMISKKSPDPQSLEPFKRVFVNRETWMLVNRPLIGIFQVPLLQSVSTESIFGSLVEMRVRIQRWIKIFFFLITVLNISETHEWIHSLNCF